MSKGYVIESDMTDVLVIRQSGQPDRRYVPEAELATVAALYDERDALKVEVKQLRAVISKHYPTIAGHCFRLKEAHEDRALAEWLGITRDFYRALEKPEEVSSE